MIRRLLVAVVAAAGCSGGSGDDVDARPPVDPLPDAANGSFLVSGQIAGEAARPGDFNGLFIVQIGEPGLHSHGLGRSVDGETFTLPLPASPPTAAQNGTTTATGYIIMTEIDDDLGTGRVEADAQNQIIGVSPDYMAVYRSAPFVTQFSWEDDFPPGWSCGLCQRNPVAGNPDALTPVDCEDVVVQMGNFTSINTCDLFGQ
jgi:hypothetical protein